MRLYIQCSNQIRKVDHNMTVDIVYISSDLVEKRKIKEIKYLLLDEFYDYEEQKVEDILKLIELEELHNSPLRLA